MSEILLAFRNLRRQPLRSGIALAAIFFGVVSLLLSRGFIEWIFWAMREATIQSRLGHIQVTRRGYTTSGLSDPFAYLLPNTSSDLTKIEADPDVKIVTQRLAFQGLISHGETTVSFLAEGVEPEKDAEVSRLLHISAGDPLASNDPKGIILGQGLASNLGVQIGDPVVLLTTTATGGINAVECKVKGLFFTLSKEYDDVALRMPIDLARTLLRISGSHIWVLLLNRTENTDQVLARLQRQFPAFKSHLQLTPWYQLADFYNQTVRLYSRQMQVLTVIIALIIILSISNTMTMTVLERTGEIGTLMAFGIKRRTVLRLFVTEGLVLGLIGGTIGVLAGWSLSVVISHVGIPMPPAPGMSSGFTGQILVTPGLAFTGFLIAFVTAALASIYPAWRASRLEIVDALRHNK